MRFRIVVSLACDAPSRQLATYRFDDRIRCTVFLILGAEHRDRARVRARATCVRRCVVRCRLALLRTKSDIDAFRDARSRRAPNIRPERRVETI